MGRSKVAMAMRSMATGSVATESMAARSNREHAVVLGASIGGLLAARVLADAYRRVTVIERDALPDGPAQRRGVPQAGHAHALLPGGGLDIGRLFPGLLDELRADGVPVIADDFAELHFVPLGHRLITEGRPNRPLAMYSPSRPLLEWRVRERVRALSNARFVDGTAVNGLVTDDTGERVTGVRVSPVDGGTIDSGGHDSGHDGRARVLDADLVVDAMGRAARTPAWLDELGYPKPKTDTVDVNVHYASQQLRMNSLAGKEKLLIVGATPERERGLGLFRHEHDMWDFTVFGIDGVRPPLDTAGMIDFVADLVPAHVRAALRAAEQLNQPHARHFPSSQWRRYDKLRRFPAGLLVFGDAIASLNPTYGQGMSVAAAEALALADCLRTEDDLARRFFVASAKIITDAWLLDAIADRALLGSRAGKPSPRERIGGVGAGRYLKVAEHDRVVAEQFLRVFGMVDRTSALQRPGVLARVVVGQRGGRRVAGRVTAMDERARPPEIPGVRRSIVTARGVDFHVTEAGSGTPVLALHGWPQHHYEYRNLLAEPPDGLRVIAPDLPGYGWSGPAPHRWAKEDVASDVLALLDELGLSRVLLVGHDWGGWIGHLMVLRAPERFTGFMALNIPHPWTTVSAMVPHLWRFASYQPLMATFGVPLQRHTPFLRRVIFGLGVRNRAEFTDDDVRVFAERFRDPVCARSARDSYRTFVLHELPALARRPERRRVTVPIHALFGVNDFAIHRSLAAAETANADDYTFEAVRDCGHFIVDERPDVVRDRLITFAAKVADR
ncbi:MAG: alpha/beta fold hydrolase [Sciscionella sp.]|nr:alpha/beta fold hydrolase [Sciscionella sp.]